MFGSVPGVALKTAPVLIFLFTVRDTAQSMNSIKKKSRSNEYLANRTAAYSTIGYYSNSSASCLQLVLDILCSHLISRRTSPED